MERAWAVFFARWIGGLMWFMAGWTKCFEMGPVVHAEKYFLESAAAVDAWMPEWLLWGVGTTIPTVELLGGGLLLLGLRVRDACVALGLVLIIVTYGHLLTDPQGAFWSSFAHVFPRTILLLAVLVLPRAWDAFSLDALLARRKSGRATD